MTVKDVLNKHAVDERQIVELKKRVAYINSWNKPEPDKVKRAKHLQTAYVHLASISPEVRENLKVLLRTKGGNYHDINSYDVYIRQWFLHLYNITTHYASQKDAFLVPITKRTPFEAFLTMIKDF